MVLKSDDKVQFAIVNVTPSINFVEKEEAHLKILSFLSLQIDQGTTNNSIRQRITPHFGRGPAL